MTPADMKWANVRQSFIMSYSVNTVADNATDIVVRYMQWMRTKTG